MRTYDLATIKVLSVREVRRFFRQRSRLVGALLQPILFWIILGSGFAHSFHLKGMPELSYLEYFFPGVIAMLVLFTAIFATMTIIEDRKAGFLQGVIAAPSSRASLVLGKTLGGTWVALIQVGLILILAPIAGFKFSQIAWVHLGTILFLTAFAFNALGFLLAWWLNSVQGYHAIMMAILFPLWLFSGAAFPLSGSSTWLKWLMYLNPMTYSVEGIRQAFYNHSAPLSMGFSQISMTFIFLLVSLFASVCFILATKVCQNSRV